MKLLLVAALALVGWASAVYQNRERVDAEERLALWKGYFVAESHMLGRCQEGRRR